LFLTSEKPAHNVLQEQNGSDAVHTNKCDTGDGEERNVDRQLIQFGDKNYEINLENLLSAKASEPRKGFTAVDIFHCGEMTREIPIRPFPKE
jgi:hypothetical protein